MPKRLAVVLTVLGVYSGIFSAGAEVYSYPFNPEIGTTWIVHETRTKTSTQDGVTPESKGEVIGRLSVTEHTPEGYLYEWTTKEVRSAGVVLNEYNAPPSLMIGLPLPFEAAADGSPIQLFNVEQLMSRALEAMETSGQEVSDDESAAMMAMFEGTDVRTLAAMFLQQANLVGTCQNYELDSEQPTVQEVYSPSLGGAPPILTINKVTLSDPGSAERPAIIVNEQYFDPDSARLSMIDLIEKTYAELGRPLPNPEDVPPFSRSTTITCEIDTQLGETRRVTSDLKVSAQGIEQTDLRELVITREN